MALPPALSIASTTLEAALASLAYVMTTVAPSVARRFAIPAPMPREPPVMSAIFPSSFLDIIFLLFLLKSDFDDPVAIKTRREGFARRSSRRPALSPAGRWRRDGE